MKRVREIDRAEQTARRRCRHHQCRECGQRATKGQLCDRDFDRAFGLGMVLH